MATARRGTSSVLVSIPVLNRPQRAEQVARSVRDSTDNARILFLCSPGDDEEISAALATGENVVVVPWECGPGDWARKHNRAFLDGAEDWVMLAADDLVFHPGWFDACLGVYARSGACVIGTNDLGNARVIAGNHSTHPLVNRDYLFCGTVDEDGKILHEGYGHQFVDDEFVQTARIRGTYAHAHDALVEHLHPDWRKSADDDTYRKGRESFYADQRLFESRAPLWRSGGPVQRAGRRRG